MNPDLKKTTLYWTSAGLLIILAVFLLVSIDQKLNTATTTNTVSFSGEGKVLAKPDVAVVSLSIVTEAATSKAAQDANSKKSQTVADFLKKQGIADKDIKTTSYNIYPQYSYPRPIIYNQGGSVGSADGAFPPTYIDNSPKITGYQVNESLEVKIRNLDNASDVLDGVVKAGANQVNNLSFQIDEPEKLKNEARAKAIADAKKKADELKGQIGIKLGKIVNFSEGFSGYPGPIMYETQALGKGGGGPSVQPGENEITVSVTLTYQIK